MFSPATSASIWSPITPTPGLEEYRMAGVTTTVINTGNSADEVFFIYSGNFQGNPTSAFLEYTMLSQGTVNVRITCKVTVTCLTQFA